MSDNIWSCVKPMRRKFDDIIVVGKSIRKRSISNSDTSVYKCFKFIILLKHRINHGVTLLFSSFKANENLI